MAIQNQLVLDHFYITVSAAQFAALLPITKHLKNAVHAKVKSGNESWEGIYIKCRTGVYFEIVTETKPDGFGIGISPVLPHYTNAANIMQELPNLEWKVGTRVLADEQPWFDWISLGDYLNVEDTIFNAWVMKYHQSNRASRPAIVPCSIDRFSKIKLEVGKKHASSIKYLAQWLPGKQKHTSTSISFLIPDREGSHFKIEIKLVPGDTRFKFKSLEMDLPRKVKVKSNDFGPFQLRANSSTATLSLKTSGKITK